MNAMVSVSACMQSLSWNTTGSLFALVSEVFGCLLQRDAVINTSLKFAEQSDDASWDNYSETLRRLTDVASVINTSARLNTSPQENRLTAASTTTCPAYSAINTNSAQQNTVPCSFYACPNQVITISTCGTCSGDTYLRLFDASGTELARGDDNCPYGGLCTYFTYTISSTVPCQYVTVRQGCHGSSSCAGTTSVTITNIAITAPPSMSPTQQPTIAPTSAPSSGFACSAYSAMNTNSAQQNTVPCSFYACPDQAITISTCGTCSGDTYLRLFEVSGTELARGDDNCLSGGLCTYFTYTISSTVSCQYVTVRQGCHGSSSCSGTTSVTISGAGLTSPPTSFPSRQPSLRPSHVPTLQPSPRPFPIPTGPTMQPTPLPTKQPTAFPTVVPTRIPSLWPTSRPSAHPTKSPTAAPSNGFACSAYSAINTNSAQQNTVPCSFYACPNQAITISTCGTCSGDTYLRLFDASGTELARGDDNCPSGGLCTYFTYTMSSTVSCQYVTVRQGCHGSSSCSGTTSVTISGAGLSSPPISSPSRQPSLRPSHVPTLQPSPRPSPIPTGPTMQPTPLPTRQPTSFPTVVPTRIPSLWPTSRPSAHPTKSPTAAPSNGFACSAYSAINTNSAQQNTVPCSFYACPYQVITISTCGTCSGDTYLRLFDASSTELARGDDNCPSGGLCTHFTYTMSSTVSCQYVTVRQGCHGSSSCSGTTSVTISGAGLTSPPTVLPTKSPTGHPTIAPSARPSHNPTHKPTAHPTLVPTRYPTVPPTEAPSQQPSRFPTHKPTVYPTLVPTRHPTVAPTEAPSQQPSRSPTYKPTAPPTHIPTPQPTTPSPSPPPTLSPTVPPASSIPHLASVQCKYFEASYTASARRNTVSCFFLACQHDTIEVSMCNTCVDDAMMRIYDANGVEIGNSDDSCGACPKWSGTRDETSCAVYEIRQGCYNDLSCSGTTTVTISSHCATGWLEYSGSCYAFNYAARDYASASTVCSDADAHVVSINSKEEANWLFGQNNWDSAYVGYVNHDGVWKWEDGTSKYENWATEEPNGGESKCAIMVNDGEMYDTNCDDKYPFFCEYSCAYCASSLSATKNNKPPSDYSTFEVVILVVGVLFGVIGCAVLVWHVRHKAQGRRDPDFSGIVMVAPPQASVNVVPIPSAPLAPVNDPALEKAQQDNPRITVTIPDPPSCDV